MICIPHKVLVGWSNKKEYDERVMWHACGKGELHARFWWGNMKQAIWKT